MLDDPCAVAARGVRVTAVELAGRVHGRRDPAGPPGLRQRTAAELPPDSVELERRPLFGQAAFRRFERELPYTTGQYVDMLIDWRHDGPGTAVQGARVAEIVRRT